MSINSNSPLNNNSSLNIQGAEKTSLDKKLAQCKGSDISAIVNQCLNENRLHEAWILYAMASRRKLFNDCPEIKKAIHSEILVELYPENLLEACEALQESNNLSIAKTMYVFAQKNQLFTKDQYSPDEWVKVLSIEFQIEKILGINVTPMG